MSDAIYGMPGAGPWMAPLVIGLVALGLGAWSLTAHVWRKRRLCLPDEADTDTDTDADTDAYTAAGDR